MDDDMINRHSYRDSGGAFPVNPVIAIRAVIQAIHDDPLTTETVDTQDRKAAKFDGFQFL